MILRAVLFFLVLAAVLFGPDSLVAMQDHLAWWMPEWMQG